MLSTGHSKIIYAIFDHVSKTLKAVEEEAVSTIAHFEEEVDKVLGALLDKEMKVEVEGEFDNIVVKE